nr:MAG TPA: hypothetical protein [Caudoviricetes sp.]DAR31794.1 MAG TPA: hypothetical protein [Bacteriophage sp.]
MMPRLLRHRTVSSREPGSLRVSGATMDATGGRSMRGLPSASSKPTH